jgi:septum formation protein
MEPLHAWHQSAPPLPPRLILASASPRRQQLLAELGFDFTVLPSGIAEEHADASPGDAIVAVARAKARAVASALRPDDAAVVLGADTEVVLDGRLLGKPQDAADAARMLRELAGRVHEVITGVAVVAPDGEQTAAVTSRVAMRGYDDAEIAAYVETGEPLDKAGAYGVQGLGGRLVLRVEGCFTNVVGLPTSTARRMLAAAGVVPR